MTKLLGPVSAQASLRIVPTGSLATLPRGRGRTAHRHHCAAQPEVRRVGVHAGVPQRFLCHRS